MGHDMDVVFYPKYNGKPEKAVKQFLKKIKVRMEYGEQFERR